MLYILKTLFLIHLKGVFFFNNNKKIFENVTNEEYNLTIMNNKTI